MKLNSNLDDYNSVYLSIKISEKMNQRLTLSAQNNKRSKTKEAYLRLSDHLERFDISPDYEKKLLKR